MEELKKKIKNEVIVIDDNIIKVDHFLNHMLDTKLLNNIGKEFSVMYPSATKIITIESSGIAYACATAFHMGYVPIVFARKSDSVIMGNHVYKRKIFSFTKKVMKEVIIDKAFLSQNDQVIIIDDFLATGDTLKGLSEIVLVSGAMLLGCLVVIEKGFQNGRREVEKLGVSVDSLANIKEIVNDEVIFYD